LEFKHPFSIAHGSRLSTPVVFTGLEHKGILGYGEASMPPYLGENHASVLSFLSRAKKILTHMEPEHGVEKILFEIENVETNSTAAKASIDMALHDLIGKILKKPCHEMFGSDTGKDLCTAYTIPMDDAPGIHRRLEEATDYKILKIKLGCPDDKKIINEIRRQTDKALIVDANEGWQDKYFALDMIQWLAKLNVLLVEQPLPKERWEDLSWLTSKSPIPLIADEGVQRFSDIEKARSLYSGINIKLMKCTGLHEALKMIAEARKYGMKIMLGCMSETSCAISAAAQIAGLVDWIDLDGPLLIKQDFFDGVKFLNGSIRLNDLPGIGARPHLTLF
jgi:L-Ala-D/L-Glu epimerase